MNQPWEEILPASQVLLIYQDSIKYGGKSSPAKPGCLEQCLGNAWSAELYLQDEESNLPAGLIFATRLYWYLAKDNCFVDGNKRVAWSCLIYILSQQFRLAIDAEDDDAVQITLGVAAGDISQDEAFTWIVSRLIEI